MKTSNVTKYFYSSSGSNNTSTIVMLSIAGGLLILFILYSVIKSTISKRKIKKQKQMIEEIATNGYQQAILDINALIEENKDRLSNFEVSIGEYKMSEITNVPKKILSELLESDVYQTVFKNNVEYKELFNQTLALKETKSNLWEKRIPNTLEFFTSLKNNFENSLTNFEGRYQLSKSRIQKYYKNKKDNDEKL
ncbi:MHJ_0274 family protein [Mycoplasma elephantis]|uniref:MHJ_0274 family protein n=1 Tax=Mycoplasma elephantis TaxID=114882 RepID=UPI000485F988|nr:hypothetical protein [Mycoplasma elephantis]